MSYPKITSDGYLLDILKNHKIFYPLTSNSGFLLDIPNYHTISYPEMILHGYKILYIYNNYVFKNELWPKFKCKG